MKGKILFLILCFCTICTLQNLQAQSSLDILYLKNGSIIKGKIISSTAESTTIQTIDGREYVFKNNEIERKSSSDNGNATQLENPDNKPMLESKNTKHKYTPAAHGYWNSTDFQLWGPISLNTVNGFKFHQFGYLGLGVGLNSYTGLDLSFYSSNEFSGMTMPIYLRYGGDILNRRVTPTYFVEGGYGFVVSDEPILFYRDKSSDKKGGVYGGLGFGFKVRTNKNFSFGASLSYKFQQTSEKVFYTDYYGNVIEQANYKYDLHRFGMKIIFIGFN